MTVQNEEKILSECFQDVTGAAPSSITLLRPHASERRIYRLISGTTSLVGIINANRQENDAFVYFAGHFANQGLPVPAIHIYKPDEHAYLEQDLGDETLFDFLAHERNSHGVEFPSSVESLYQRSLEYLVEFQIKGAENLDFNRCHPETDLLPGTFAGDCASFAHDLVARLLPTFDITSLTSDFAALIAFLEEAQGSYFVYRDFQSRNIMRVEGKPFFIDFQSGRRGPLQYDVVSLLYQASAKIPLEARNRLVEHFCKAAARHTNLDVERFHKFLSGFIICRMLQVLGVYGRQGLGAGKEYFTNSIPSAITTLAQELNSSALPIKLPRLGACAQNLRDASTLLGKS